jgi:four helix bundle protein
MASFRFEDLKIRKLGSEIGDDLFDIADMLSDNKKFRFSEQLYGAAMSITNNIAEGSGSSSKKDFANFLNISRRSVFECANILCILQRRSFISKEIKELHFRRLQTLSKMITNFRKNLFG